MRKLTDNIDSDITIPLNKILKKETRSNQIRYGKIKIT